MTALDEDGGPHVVTRQLLLPQGCPDEWFRREVRAGRAVRHAPGVYVASGTDLPARIAAAFAHAGPDALLTGWAGCRLLGIAGAAEQAAVSVLVGPQNRRASTQRVRVLRTTRRPRWRVLPASSRAAGVRVASSARCVVDAARQLDDLAAVRHLLMSAVRHPDVDVAELHAELDAGARNGSGLCRRALDDVVRGAASPPEAELADLVVDLARRRRLPPFLLNPEVWFRGQLLGRPDGWFVGLGLGWEVDSRQFHLHEDAFDDTLDRHGRFGAAAVLLLHVTPRRFRELGHGYGQVLEAAVRARQEEGYRSLPGLEVIPRGPVLPEPVRRRS